MRPRLDAVDFARGVALVAMAAYHLTWDLAQVGLIWANAPFTPPMRLASHIIGAAFLLLAGVSLKLAQAPPRAYLRRLARIGAAAALVSAASYTFAPAAPIWFGILHCIFAASLLAWPLIARPRVALALGLALLGAPWIYASPNLLWIGLGTTEPSTLDWRPLLPWGGFVLLGLALAPPIPEWQAKAPPARALTFAGRHSLAIYLAHQPLLLGLLYAGVQLTGYSDHLDLEAYTRTCRPACVEAGGELEACARACACVTRDASAQGLAGALTGRAPPPQTRERVSRIVAACGEAQ